MVLLCIDIKSQFGAFNKPFSNTGGLLTYPFPPKTTVVGMLGAILGYDLEKTVDRLMDFKIGVQPLRSIDTETITYNCHYGGRKDRMVNIKQEIIITPDYRIFIEVYENSENDEFIQEIRELLQLNGIPTNIDSVGGGLDILFENNLSYFSLYMGKNEFPLTYQKVDKSFDKLNFEEVDKYMPTECVVPRGLNSNPKVGDVEKIAGLEIKRPKPFNLFLVNDVPVKQTPDRKFIEFRNFFLKNKGNNNVMMINPQEDDGCSFYRDESNTLIICF